MDNQPKNASDLKGKSGITRLINATKYSKQGLVAGWKSEEALRQEIILACVMVPTAVFLPIDYLEKIFLIASVFIVLITEVLNSAIEAVVDRFGTEIHPLSGKAKDLGSLAVLLALTLCAIVWVSILVHNFL